MSILTRDAGAKVESVVGVRGKRSSSQGKTKSVRSVFFLPFSCSFLSRKPLGNSTGQDGPAFVRPREEREKRREARSIRCPSLLGKKKIACCTHNGDTGTRQRTLTCWSCRMPSGARIKERLGLGCSLLNRLTAGASSCKRRRLKAWLTCRDGVPRLSHHHMWDPNLAIPGDEDQNPRRKSNRAWRDSEIEHGSRRGEGAVPSIPSLSRSDSHRASTAVAQQLDSRRSSFWHFAVPSVRNLALKKCAVLARYLTANG